jgi:Zn-dependent peptidase ImmA (M78 family)
MLHELAHVALRRGGLCDLSDLTGPHGEEQQVEVFCNAVAGATLVPMGQLLAHEMVSKTPRGADWSDQAIDALSDDFSVSREVVLRRLLKADRISVVFFRKKRKQYLREYHSLRRKKGFAPPSRLVVSRSGPSFVRLVLSAYYQERITAADVSDYLETKLKHMPEVESAVMGHAVEFGATG